MPQLRQNPITGDWVVIAPERAKRPTDFVTSGMVRRDHKKDCVFCIGRSAWKERIRDKKSENDSVYVFPNKFPAFVESEDKCERRSFPTEDFFVSKGAVGGHEVLVVKDHDLLLPKFPKTVMADLLRMMQSRYTRFAQAPCRPEYVMGVYNYGPEAGASIWHPHAQVFASAVVPNLVSAEKHGAERYFEANGVCVFCDLLHHEQRVKVRQQIETKRFTSFNFFAARFPFELWILPKEHESRFEDASSGQIDELAGLLMDLLHRLDETLNNPPLNIFIHTLPTTSQDSDYYHWHIEIAPRLAIYGGFELGGQTIIDIVSPEKAAEYYRKQ